jgi:hypothetical protein
MAKKKAGKTPKAERELKATVKKLRRRLDSAESATERWRGKAKKHKANAAKATAESGRLRKRLEATSAEKAGSKQAPAATVGPARSAPASKAPGAKRAPAEKAAAGPAFVRSTAPDATWTLAALRAEARARGLSGYSRSSKAALLAQLR